MSDSENRKVQDVLREVADCGKAHIANVLSELQDALDIKQDDGRTWGEDARVCLFEIADRIDKQSVVEVKVPSDPFARITELYPMTRAEAISAIEHWLAGRNVAPKPCQPEPQPEPTELECLAAPNIYLSNCIIHVYGGADDQSVQPLD